jgi:hypothetical protein
MKRHYFVLSFGVAALMLAAPAHAQLAGFPAASRPSYANERQPYYEASRGAFDNGYREGLKEGENDARRRDRFDFRDERDWERGDVGYHRSYGDRDRYRYSFRSGFEAGYEAGYRRYAGNYGYGRDYPRGSVGPYGSSRYPGRSGYPGGYGYSYNPAFANGARDGYEKGREDARDGDRYDPRRHKWYREGDRDYEREYGSKQVYEDVYRRGFLEGYERGYRESRYRR